MDRLRSQILGIIALALILLAVFGLFILLTSGSALFWQQLTFILVSVVLVAIVIGALGFVDGLPVLPILLFAGAGAIALAMLVFAEGPYGPRSACHVSHRWFLALDRRTRRFAKPTIDPG